jgi:Skp family chaperone for outer membrane proteins
LKQATQIQNSAEKEKDSKSKDIEKLQTKVQQLEGKLKSSNAENTALIAEKASLEREFKSSKSGHGVLEKEVTDFLSDALNSCFTISLG